MLLIPRSVLVEHSVAVSLYALETSYPFEWCNINSRLNVRSENKKEVIYLYAYR